jgi:poly(hydroxyalkanoate) depolymerase family esterase
MNFPSRTDMKEASRLTREGRLAEAMALLRGEPAGAAAPPSPASSPFAGRLSGLARMAQTMAKGFEKGLEPAGRTKRPSSAPAPSAAAPGRFETRSFAGAGGSREYKLYIPATLPPGPRPLVVMLHGCTQSPDDFAAGTRMNELAEKEGVLVAYPAQSRAANAQKCWNWFNVADQQRETGEPALIAGIAQAIIAEGAVDPARVYVAGLSAGGAAAAIMASTHPDLFAAVGVHSGLACGAARDMPSAFAAMKKGGRGAAPARGRRVVPTIVFHGDSDATVHPVNGEHVIAQSAPGGTTAQRETHARSPGGMDYTCTVHNDPHGRPVLEHWQVQGLAHAWSGGSADGSYTEPNGPDASREMLRFFLAHPRAD